MNMKKTIASVLGLVLASALLPSCDLINKIIGKEEENPDQPKAEKTYTYHMGPSDLPTAWNIHTYETNSSTYVLDYSSDSLYTFDYKDEKCDAYQIVPSMASDYATDVTSQYVGKFGITAEDEHKAWAIPLKDNLKFDNGEAITAETFVESMKLLLNPDAANFRADNMYSSGSIKIVGSEAYVKQGRTTFATAAEEGVGWTGHPTAQFLKDGTFGETEPGSGKFDGTYSFISYVGEGDDQESVYDLAAFRNAINLTVEEQEELIFSDEDSYIGKYGVENYGAKYGVTGLTTLLPLYGLPAEPIQAMCGKSLKEILADDDMCEMLILLNYEFWCTDVGEEFGWFATSVTWEDNFSFDNVGFFADEQGRLVIVLINPMEDNFYLRYELCTSFFLVNPTVYKACMTTSQGVYTNSYGTSVDTYVGFGPYKLTSFVSGSSLHFERNPYWHGYADNKEAFEAGTFYQTTAIDMVKVAEDATRLEMFQKGQLDSYGLTSNDMATFAGSKYIVYTDSESTWFMAMNPQKANLEIQQGVATAVTEGKTNYAVVKTVLAIDEFRQALSYGLDRQQFILTCNPTSGVAASCLSSMIIADPDTGLAYRATEEGKDAILEFWGLSDSYGPGKEYATKDDAIASITGYDPAGAKVLLQQAYEKAVEQELITAAQVQSGEWMVQINIGKSGTSSFYTKGYEFFKAAWENLVVGTPFEGHLECISTQLNSSNFSDNLKTGKVDVLFGVGFGGSMFDPFSMLECFTGTLAYDVYTNKKAVSLEIELDLGEGVKTYKASLYDWLSKALQGTEIDIEVVGEGGRTVKFNGGTNCDKAIRLQVLAKCEAKILTLSNMFPLMTDASASLRGARINYKTSTYILGMGFGGIQYYTYSMDDTEFAAAVAQLPNGIIDYTVGE